MIEVGSTLNVPASDSGRFETNYLGTVVTEFRFPTLLELEKQVPVELRRRLKHEYPHYSPSKRITLTPGAPAQADELVFDFWSRKRDWKVTIGSNALSLETTAYLDFDDFISRAEWLMRQAFEFLDSRFFTRVGLRYVNHVPVPLNEIDGWINHDLVAPFAKGIFGDVKTLNTELSGRLKKGRYSFRHGIGSKVDESQGFNRYFLDFDYYDEDVEYEDLWPLLRSFHVTNFSFFYWALGDKAKAQLGQRG
jgi:uncharacterized protein (TIGR04255 family)